jgi:hypothetical protein
MILNRNLIRNIIGYANTAYVLLALTSREYRDMCEQFEIEKKTAYLHLTRSKELTVWGHTVLKISIKKLGKHLYSFDSLQWLISRGFRPNIRTGKDSPSRRVQKWRSEQVFYSLKKQPSICIDMITGECRANGIPSTRPPSGVWAYQPSGYSGSQSSSRELSICLCFLHGDFAEIKYIPIPPYKIVYPVGGFCTCTDCRKTLKIEGSKSFQKHMAFSIPATSELFQEYAIPAEYDPLSWTALFRNIIQEKEVIRVQVDQLGLLLTLVYAEYLRRVRLAT